MLKYPTVIIPLQFNYLNLNPMNKLLNYIVICLLLCNFLSCNDPAEIVDDTIIFNAVEKLISPLNKSSIKIGDDLRIVEKFEWQKALTSKGIYPDYEVIFFKVNETSNEPLYKIGTTNNSLTLNHNKLSEIATLAGINQGESGTIKWCVRAFNESVSLISKEVFEINITLPKVKSEVSKLYLTGVSTEFGDNIADAMELTKISNSEFVIFTELKNGQLYNFINSKEGDNIRYFSVINNKLIEDKTSSQVMKSGVYKITVDIAKETVSYKEITDLSLYYSIKHRAISLQYRGKGIWKTICLINFSKEQWGDETRYKFRMTEGDIKKFIEKSTDGNFSMKESVISNHDQQLWDGVWSYSSNLKNRWAEVSVDLSNYSHTINAVTEDFSSIISSWDDIADNSTSDFIKGFWNSSTKHFNNSITGTVNRYDYWPEAHALDVVIDAYLRSGNNSYKQIIYDFHEGVKRKNGNTFKNSFYDDMAWHGLAHLRAYEATQDSRYEASAQSLWKWILEGWDYNGGGIKWNDQPGSIPGVPSTGPATIIGVRRWVKYGDTEITDDLNNLEWAKKMYSWMRIARHDPATGAVYDDFNNKSGAWTYNTGTFLGSAMELYDVTGESSYLEDAIRTADWTIENLSVSTQNNKILSDWAEQEDHDVNLFKGIFIRYFTRLIMHPDLPSEKKDKYIRFIEYNAKALLTYATSNSERDTMIYNYGWYFIPKNSFLRAQISGSMLVEALALLENEGYL